MIGVIRRHPQRLLRPNWWLGLALVAILTSGCATAASFTAVDTGTVDRLLGLMKERLDAAPEVARTKWNTKAPIEDLPRDQQIIDGVAKAATEYGLDPHVASTFFRGQIEASKAIQRALHAEWIAKRQPPFAEVADLGKDIRPVLDRLTPAMMRALAEALPGTRATRRPPTAGSADQGDPLHSALGRGCGARGDCPAADAEQVTDGPTHSRPPCEELGEG